MSGHDHETRRSYETSGIGGRSGVGQKPAVVAIDLQVGFTSAECQVGGVFDSVVESSARVLARSREIGLPVVFTAVAIGMEHVASPWLLKMPGLACLEPRSRFVEIDPRLEPRPEEPCLVKSASSGFFGTALLEFLISRNIDTVIAIGLVTSGCVRATAVDAVSYGFKVIIPRGCVGDRTTAVHEANLADMDAKYADVMSTDEVLRLPFWTRSPRG